MPNDDAENQLVSISLQLVDCLRPMSELTERVRLGDSVTFDEILLSMEQSANNLLTCTFSQACVVETTRIGCRVAPDDAFLESFQRSVKEELWRQAKLAAEALARAN